MGRVQTPTLYLIYTRQQEIHNFKPEPFYELFANIKVENGTFQAKYKDRFAKKDDLTNFMKDQGLQSEENTTITKLTKESKKTKSPKLHSLSTLQTKANKKWKYSPTDVLKIMQNLYEKKLLTYPRTDSNYITESEFAYLKSNFSAYQSVAGVSFDMAFPDPQKRYVNGSKVQEHFSIVPTKTIPKAQTIEGLNEKERNIYFEVLLNTLAMFAPDYLYEETKVEVDVKGVVFHAKGKVEKDRGWKALFANEQSKKTDREQETKLPSLSEGEGALVSPKIKDGMTQPPKPYTEGQLINMMKTCGKAIDDSDSQQILKDIEGLGTEATRANIIETLKKQQYISIKKNKVEVTKKGEILCQSVEGTLLSKAEMTAKWEQFLRLIGEGQKTKEGFLKNIDKFIHELMNKTPESLDSTTIEQRIEESKQEISLGKCPSCQKGNVVDKRKFFGCTEYKNGCRFTFPKKIASKNISEANVKKLLAKGKTNLIKGFASKKGKSFDAYLIWEDAAAGKIKFEFDNKKSGRKKKYTIS
ncbi:type IA DNA topoisomerase [Halobacillus amylolyticus]|uniref:type IA DNA topoisomerase n=1 Tax=Halobacillus amylolyticus TaxID=2932259 RepID=UPI00296249D5|nr:DNA topoisomerase [Halobacillus amylolyticus]